MHVRQECGRLWLSFSVFPAWLPVCPNNSSTSWSVCDFILLLSFSVFSLAVVLSFHIIFLLSSAVVFLSCFFSFYLLFGSFYFIIFVIFFFFYLLFGCFLSNFPASIVLSLSAGLDALAWLPKKLGSPTSSFRVGLPGTNFWQHRVHGLRISWGGSQAEILLHFLYIFQI